MYRRRARWVAVALLALLSIYYVASGPSFSIDLDFHDGSGLDFANPLVHYPTTSKDDNFAISEADYEALLLSIKPSIPGRDTPLFIGFTTNWLMLQQAIVSYIAAGWPPSQIYVMENTGVMDSNERRLLSIHNQFYLDVPKLKMLGVTHIRTPTLLTFAQLQNFMASTAIDRGLGYYFWSHMDVIILPDYFSESFPPPQRFDSSPLSALSLSLRSEGVDYSDFYGTVLRILNDTLSSPDRWAVRFFAFDWLTLVNVETFVEAGGFDTLIPYYTTDCDFYGRLQMAGYELDTVYAGFIFDSAFPVADLTLLFFSSLGVERIHQVGDCESEKRRYKRLYATLRSLEFEKGRRDRNIWQVHSSRPSKAQHKDDAEKDGKGDPFWIDAMVYSKALARWQDLGRDLYHEKWRGGRKKCELFERGKRLEDMWRSFV